MSPYTSPTLAQSITTHTTTKEFILPNIDTPSLNTPFLLESAISQIEIPPVGDIQNVIQTVEGTAMLGISDINVQSRYSTKTSENTTLSVTSSNNKLEAPLTDAPVGGIQDLTEANVATMDHSLQLCSKSSFKTSTKAISISTSKNSCDSQRSIESETEDGKDYENFGGDKESFDAFKPKVIELCHAIGYGDPDEVERMEGGSYNKVIGLQFSSPSEGRMILRLPYFVYEDDESQDISDQVSILLYLAQFEFLKAPHVLAYDTTANNPIKSQYVIQTRLPGVNMEKVFYKLSLAEKLDLTEQIAEMALRMSEVKLPGPGRLIGPRNLPATGQNPDSLKHIHLGGYRQRFDLDPLPADRQCLPNLLLEIFRGCANNEDWLESKYRELQRITHEMVKAGLVRHCDADNGLWHWDFCARNILVREELLSGLDRESNRVKSTCSSEAGMGGTSTGCQHKFNFSVEDSGSDHKHAVEVKVEEVSDAACEHSVSVIVDGINGTKYQHHINVENQRRPMLAQSPTLPGVADDLFGQNSGLLSQAHQGDVKKRWVISGVIDWDEVLSVPLVIANRPHSWLWFDEKERPHDWDGEEDEKPPRDLTNDELLIKSHFDQIMAIGSPDYWQDAYGRGVWIRKLTRFARDGFRENNDWRRFEQFVADWAKYYDNLGFNRKPDVVIGQEEANKAFNKSPSGEAGEEEGNASERGSAD